MPVAFLLCLPVWSTPSPFSLLLLSIQGAGGLAAQFAFTRAMKLADASLLILVDFIRLPLAVFLGLTLFNEPVEIEIFPGRGSSSQHSSCFFVMSKERTCGHRELTSARTEKHTPLIATSPRERRP